MLTLFHHPFCPHSRFVRLAFGEYGVTARMVEERVWERRQEFLALNPDCTTPVLVEEGYPAVPGPGIIAEFLDETRGAEFGEQRLLPREPGPRVEVRRLMNWFNDKFFAEVSGPLTMERLYKRQMPVSAGGGSPDTDAIRAARQNMRYHLAYIGWLVRTRDWLAGPRMSYADLAAAAHLSAADYLGDVPWNEDEAAKTWYAQLKSRTSTSERSGRTQNSAGRSRTSSWLRHRRHHATRFDSARARAPAAVPGRRRSRRHGMDGNDCGAAGRSARVVAAGALRHHPGAQLWSGRQSAGDPEQARPGRHFRLRPGRRLPRHHQAAAQSAGALAHRTSRRRREGVRRHRGCHGETARRRRRRGLAGQAHQSCFAAVRIVAVSRRDLHHARAAGGCAGDGLLRHLPRLHRHLPHRRVPRALSARCAPLHLVSHHRAQGSHPA